jgi:hypothetical protein
LPGVNLTINDIGKRFLVSADYISGVVWQKADYYLELTWFGPPNDMTSSNVINGQVHD